MKSHNKRRMVCFALDIDAFKTFMFESMHGREIPRNVGGKGRD